MGRAARAVLAVMEEQDVPALATAAGAALVSGLEALPKVKAVRGLGLLIAAELDGLDSRTVAAAALRHGLIVNAITPTALRMAPSLLVTDDEIDEAMHRLGLALADAAAEGAA